MKKVFSFLYSQIRRLPRLLANVHIWILVLLFTGGFFLHYPQLLPFIGQIDPDSFLYLTRHSVGRLIMLLPVTYTALVFGLRPGLVSLLLAIAIIIPNIFVTDTVTADDIIEIIGIIIIGLVVNLWLESYETDKKHRQQAYLKMETAQRELQRMQQNLRFYLKQITIAQEDERRRIAQELHDDTAQDLIVISRAIDRFVTKNPNLGEDNLAELEEMQNHINRTLSEVRRFAQDLRPSVLDDLGLIPALEWLIPDLSKHFGINIDIDVNGEIRRFAPETELVLFRIVQESLRNVGKHAQATKAWVYIDFGKYKATLTVKDNGKGFLLPERVGDLAALGKLGLTGMQERAQLIGGRLSIQSKPDVGTMVTVAVPNSGNLEDDDV
ncbi:ATPase [Dehalococcoides mccartyi]|jgi:signal transduction histidine kinase|uniref:histidine kinase n=3 Tax=Dehalococcoides mccartyi TaxID=61435 RepID=A0A142VB15_9CHLR|nr:MULTISPECIES: sensor histidine kinase [Dehalococcoides]AGG06291.1 signal transduction histidine kinase [Dehalococcoides mccartyi DCMB5]AGG07723.1 signal transduction histidine kinase [Dehalococcoides mccartyi BTF08]AII60755.1 ATPase [Dehalococcoides mccartyi CG5]AMU86425.1 sensor histidine kinase [Dehalococcoides mccartyi]AOV99254.1 sensor histidine kinase [Dehalococcoides mccartyi]